MSVMIITVRQTSLIYLCIKLKNAKIMRGKNKLIYLFFLTNFLMLNAQQEILISLDDVLSKAAEKNYTIKISEEDVNAAKAEYNQTKSVFLPNINEIGRAHV